jgi:uncharacterized protein (TIGR02466 family)
MFNTIFSSFIYDKLLNLNLDIFKKEIKKIKKNKKGVIETNYGGWQSNSIFKIKEPFNKLFKSLDSTILEISNTLYLEKKIKLLNYWININKLGSFNRPHEHKGAIISGVFYINTPKKCGKICFEQPTDVTYIYGKVTKFNHLNSSAWTWNPKENLCLLFPSYLKHYVEPNLNKKERISISFNYGYQDF